MELGIIGLGRMGLNMAIRLHRDGHRVVGTNRDTKQIREAEKQGIIGAENLEQLVGRLDAPRVVWLMIPVGKPVDETLDQLVPMLARGDVVVDGGNSNFKDTMRRAGALSEQGIDYIDSGTSGGVWGLENGYALMIGGRDEPVQRLSPIFQTLAPPEGWAHVGPSGAGHFAKMVHNGIEYGMLQAYAEGFEILHESDFDFDLGQLSHVWNHGGVVRSWLLELAELAFQEDPKLDKLTDHMDDSGMGRWTAIEAIDQGVPAPVITLSLMARFRSRQEQSFAGKVVAALRRQFGGHAVKRSS
jgi:6-phosphogluconate dehydrogenase